MIVMVGPPWAGSDEDYARLAGATGMLAYDLRTRLKPNFWGVVKPLGDPAQAQALAEVLSNQGFRACAVDPAVASDPMRPVVPLTGLELGPERLTLHLTERSMQVSSKALLVIVRGEVQLGQRTTQNRTSSSASFRAVSQSAADLRAVSEARGFDAFAAADLHFATVAWVARVDARSFDFSFLPGSSGNVAQDLDLLVEYLSERTGARVDRGAKASSVLSYAVGPARSATPVPGQPPVSRAPPGSTDERFDGYSRLVAEAERATRGFFTGP
ncbi:MAG TPA: hypothetical protein PKD61_36125 [Polyangiaceae bacterium]|nr:hypothetical protein [Polyangiaceae bacterium]